MRKHNYIICIHEDRYEIIGPFSSMDDLDKWGMKWQAKNGDRATWQSIYVADPHAAPVVITP